MLMFNGDKLERYTSSLRVRNTPHITLQAPLLRLKKQDTSPTTMPVWHGGKTYLPNYGKNIPFQTQDT